jgi:hypothetical protein
MYERLNDQWASTLLAFISLACCAIPFLFWKYGAKIRGRSKYAYAGDDETVDDIEKAKGRGNTHGGAQVRDDSEDEDLRRARSYVSNP